MKRKSAFVGGAGGPVVGKVQRKASAIVGEILATSPAAALPPAGGKVEGNVEPGSIWDFGDRVPQARHAFKVLCTDDMAAALLRGKGAVKDQLQQETGSKLVFSNRGDYFPQTTYRVLGVYANEVGVFKGVFERIVQYILELGQKEQAGPPSQAPEYLGKEAGEFVFRFCVTIRMSAQLIGSQGANISWIRKDTGAKVFIENEAFMGHRLARVVGQPDRILKCLNHINEFVQLECSQPYYAPYFGIVNFSDKDERRIDDLLREVDDVKGKGKGGDVKGKGKKGPEQPAGKNGFDQFAGKKGGGGGSGGIAPGGGGAAGQGGTVLRAVPGGGGQALRSWQSAVPVAGGAAAAAGGEAGGGGFSSRGVPVAVATVPGQLSKEADIDALAADLEAFPEGTTSAIYSIECRLVLRQEIEADFLSFILESTDSEVTLEPVDGDLHQVTVVGAVPNVYVAHAMLVLKALTDSGAGGGGGGGAEENGEEDWGEAEVDAMDEASEDPEVLMGYIARLEEKLFELERYDGSW